MWASKVTMNVGDVCMQWNTATAVDDGEETILRGSFGPGASEHGASEAALGF